jgi:uncharacterized protein
MFRHERHRFLVVAGSFEASLAVVAVAIGWLAGVDPLEHLVWDGNALATGMAAALPIFIGFAFAFYDPFIGMTSIRNLLLRLLGPPLAACRWYDLLLLATIAGLGEELLFRGLLQPWIARGTSSEVAGLVLSNLLFGLAHAITFVYAVVAGLIGLYLGWLLDATGSRNLLVPVATHAFYDFLAFVVVARAYRESVRESAERAANEAATDGDPEATITDRRSPPPD